MFRKLTLAILAAAFVVSPALAQSEVKSVQETREQTAHIAWGLRNKNQELTARVAELERREKLHATAIGNLAVKLNITDGHVRKVDYQTIGEIQKRIMRLENTSPINPSDTLRIQTLEKKVHSLTQTVKMLRERVK